MTTHAQISHDLYKWLVQFHILPNTLKYKASGNFQLQYRLQQQLQSGYLVSKLLANLAAEKAVALNEPLITSIKNSNTPAARVYNWNILNQSFVKLGINLSKQNQKQITSGNFDSLVLFLMSVQNKTSSKKPQKTSTTPPPQQALDIKKVHKYEQVDQSETVLQFIIVLISKSIGLTPKQAVATLAESGKYLAHMIVKGVKNSFEQVISFIDDARSKMDKLIFLAEKDAQKNVQFLLQIFKPTLISRDVEVVKAGTLALKSFCYECFKFNTKNIIYQVLSKQSQGFDFVYMGLKRHPYLNYHIFEFLYPFLRGLLKDFLDIQLKRTINNDQQYYKTIILIIQPLLQNKEAKDEVMSSGLFAQWQKALDNATNSKLKGKDTQTINEQTKFLVLQLVYILWLGYYKDLEASHAQQLLIKITQQLKKLTRSQIYTFRIPSLLKIFNLLDFLATNKNKLAALLYKKIIFLFVQNHSEDQMRQIVLQNLTLIISKFPSIPLQFLLQPMLKQLTNKQGTSYILNMYDFQFILQLCKHPKMQQYYAITFLDYFTRLYTKSVIYSSLIFRIIEAITARFCESEQIRQYCLKSTDLSLNNYGMLVMGKTKGNRANYQNVKSQNKEELIINNQKKSLIIELIKHFVSLEHKEMTDQIKEKVATLFIQWYENKSHYDKGLAAILMQIGDVEQILLEFKQNKPKTNLQKHDSKQTPFGSSSVNQKQQNTGRVMKNQSKALKYQDYFNVDQKSSPNISDIGLGYKKKRKQTNKQGLSKFQIIQSRTKNIKPDPKVLEDIQRIKQKWKLEQSRAKVQQQSAKKRDKSFRINQKQLLQRNLSLGYAKLPSLSSTQIMFEFDSVKKRHLKDSLDLINFQQQETREQKSYSNIIQRYQKYIKSLFVSYASSVNSFSEDKQSNMISFTQIMRMLKDKDLIAKIPKIAINQIITTINQKRKKEKNVLGGIYEQDFPMFILYYTDLLLQQDAISKKDQPFGLKVQKVILRMLQGQKHAKQLFDPKMLKLKQELQYDQKIQIPQDCKKVKQTQIQLDYNFRNLVSKIDASFIDCYQIVDGIVYQALGVHIVSPITNFKQKFTVVKLNKNIKVIPSKSVDKKIGRAGTQQGQSRNGVSQSNQMKGQPNLQKKDLQKITKNLLKKKSQSQRNFVDQETKKKAEQRDKKRQQHAAKLKQLILKQREEKEKLQQQKKQKQKIQQQKKKKKQQIRKQYLQQNKKKVLQKKQQDERKIQLQQNLKKENAQKRKAEVKAKQGEMLQKQLKLIQKKKQKLETKVKAKQQKIQQRQKINKSKSNDKLLEEMKTNANDQKMKDLLIKNSMQNGQIKQIIEKNKKNFEQLFEIYWNWEIKKIELKNLAQMLKDLQTIKYIQPKDISDVYKNVSKGQVLNLQGFIEAIVRLSYRSTTIAQQLNKGKKEEKTQNQNKIQTGPVLFMLKLLKMNQGQNYKQNIIRIKNEKAKS